MMELETVLPQAAPDPHIEEVHAEGNLSRFEVTPLQEGYGMTLGNAQRLLQERQRSPVRDIGAPPARAYFPADPQTNLDGVGIASRYFIVEGRLRLGDRVLEERSLVERRQLDIVVLSRERINLRDSN